MKFIYNGKEYPHIIPNNEDYEKQIVLIPEISGDYFMAIIDSSGGYEVVDCVGESEVEVKI